MCAAKVLRNKMKLILSFQKKGVLTQKLFSARDIKILSQVIRLSCHNFLHILRDCAVHASAKSVKFVECIDSVAKIKFLAAKMRGKRTHKNGRN